MMSGWLHERGSGEAESRCWATRVPFMVDVYDGQGKQSGM